MLLRNDFYISTPPTLGDVAGPFRWSRQVRRKVTPLISKAKRSPVRRKMSRGDARRKFLIWFRGFNPKSYNIVMRQADTIRRMMGPTLSGNGLYDDNMLDGVGSIWDDIVDLANKTVPVLVQGKAQMDLYKAQMKRAEKGLPPLKTEEIAPTVKVQAEVGPETRQQLIQEAGAGFKKYILPIGLVLGTAGAAFFLTRAKRKK